MLADSRRRQRSRLDTTASSSRAYRSPGGAGRKRRFQVILTAILIIGLFVVLQSPDASTGSVGNATDYLTWFLKNEQAGGRAARRIRHPALVKADSGSSASQLLAPFPGARVFIERVRSGDTLSNLLQRRDVPMRTVLAVARAAKPVFDLGSRFQPGKVLKLTFGLDNSLIGLDYPLSETRTIRLEVADKNRFTAMVVTNPVMATEKAASKASKASKGGKPDPRANTVFHGADRWVKEKIRKGDNLSSVLARHRVSRSTAIQVSRAAKPVFDLSRSLQPKDTIRLALSNNGLLVGLSYPMDRDRMLLVTRDDGVHFVPHVQQKSYSTRLEVVSGVIGRDGSLFTAGKSAGLTQSLAIQLAGLFEWDVDFARDIRSGDGFRVVHEVKYDEGKRVRNGKIVAAEFVNQGQVFRVVRYTDPSGSSGYYDAKGRNVRKMFIRAPVDFTRISSLFSQRRKHPVYGYTRAHKGVDYAAPTGTPVRAAGDGRIAFVGRKGGFGKLILVRHNGTYTTAYAHLSRYSRGLRNGQRVAQGQVIGLVGATGAATGPHLHYEIRIRGKQVNPLSIQLPGTNAIPRAYMNDFRIHSSRMLAHLKSGKTTRVAALGTVVAP